MPKMFGKVFLAFWASSLLVFFAVAILGLALGSRPLVRLWMTQSLDFYAQTAVDLYEHGGETTLAHYLDDIQSSSAIDGALLSPNGTALAQHPVPEQAQEVVGRAWATGQPQYNTQNWTVAFPVQSSHGTYILAARVHPWRRRYLALNPWIAIVRGLAGLAVAALLCFFIARYLTRPIRTLQTVARQIASGDLRARATPWMGRRKDELGELAFDFDLMAERVQTLIERQQTLLRDISHELRSPLTRLNLSAELVRRGDMYAAQRMDADIRRLEELISELLTLSRIEASERNTRRDTVHLGSMIRQVLQDAAFEGHPEEKSLVQSGLNDLTITGDANLLQRCIENVVRNAIRYTRPHTTIEVNLDRSHDGDTPPAAVIRVIDEGPGVPPAMLPRLFEPFFRASESRDHKNGGVGLGLSICQRIVALHGGRIEASNRLEGGLEVAMYLPLEPVASGMA